MVEFVLGVMSYFSTDLQPGYLLAISFDSAEISSILSWRYSTVSSDSSKCVRNDSFHTLDPITEISFDDTPYASPAGAVALDQVVLNLSSRS